MAAPLDCIEARDPWTIIQELSAARARSKHGEPIEVPLATFHLRGGRDLRGFVLDLREGSRSWSLLVAPSSDPLAVTYLDPKAVEAVTVHDAARNIDVLSFGAIEHSEGAPSPIAVRRRVQELERELSAVVGEAVTIDIVWDGIPAGDAVVLSVARTIDAIEAAVRDIATATDAADLRGCFATIRLEHGSAPGVTTEGEVLVVSAALERGRLGRFDRGALKKAIEAAL